MTSPRLPLGRAHLLAGTALAAAHDAGLPVVGAVGSLRRLAPDIGDVTLLAVADPTAHATLFDAFAGLPFVTGVVTRQRSRLVVNTARGPVALVSAAPEHAGASLVWHTGSHRHTAALQERARHGGLHFADGRLTGPGRKSVATATELDLYASLDLPLVPPELRETGEEIATIAREGLPPLVATEHIRGDLHMHSTWSDGRNSIEEMVRAARGLGYEYVAMTDHSERSWASRSLRADEIGRQQEEIEAVRARVPGIEVLHGVEVDIMPDGTLDFPDQVLEQFDIVLASLHDRGGHDSARLTERYLRAIQHPLVSVITHPANRSPAHDPGYDLDFDRVFEAAIATGTALEIDGAPGHLDMDGVLARRAVAAGATVVIDSDCHRVEALGQQMRFGVAMARRGWVEPAAVLNTRGADHVRAFIARKRARA